MHTGGRWNARRSVALCAVVAFASMAVGCQFMDAGSADERVADPAVPVETPSPLAADPATDQGTAPEPTGMPPAMGMTYIYENPYPDGEGTLGAAGFGAPSDYRRISYRIPAAWQVRDPYIGKNLGEPDEVALSFWTTSGIYPDACHRTGATLNPVDLHEHDHGAGGSIVLANPGQGGLATQAGRGASEPTEVMIGGQLALRMELSVPADLDIESCDGGVYRSWPYFYRPDVGNDNHVPGQMDIVYLVDVDRSPILIDASYRMQSSPEDRAELEAVLASLHIVR